MSIDFYEDIIKALDLLKERGQITDNEGKSLFGDGRWENIYGWFKVNTGKKFIIYFGSLNLRNPADIEATRERCLAEIKRMKDEERSQKLSDRSNLSTVLANWATFILALWGALTGTFAFLNQIFKWF